MERNNDVKAFLGTGWKFPIEVDEATGRIKMTSHEENIEESVRVIIGTRKGERIMQPEFGCRIHDYTFEVVDYTMQHSLKNEIEDALIRWEPRITDIDIEISDEQINQGKLIININYKVRATNNYYNLVYPFYISEGEY